MTTQTPEARLLVVEDEPNIRELLATSLRYAGFDVATAATGQRRSKVAGDHQPDLCVLDVMLPDRTASTVTRRLREQGRQLPIVFVTARDSVDDKIKGLTVGGDDYVTKPFSLEEVVARIRAVLRRTPRRAQRRSLHERGSRTSSWTRGSPTRCAAPAGSSRPAPPSSSCCAT